MRGTFTASSGRAADYNSPDDAKRAIKRAARWMKANPDADYAPPRHIMENEDRAVKYLRARGIDPYPEEASNNG